MRWLAAMAVLGVSSAAWGQSATLTIVEGGTPYLGGRLVYDTEYQGVGGFGVDELVFDLGNALDLIRVEDGTGGVVLSEAELAVCGADCGPKSIGSYEISTASTRRQVVITALPTNTWHFRFVVRFARLSCSAPSVQYNGTDAASFVDSVVPTACNDGHVLGSLTAIPAALALQRSQPLDAAGVTFVGQIVTGTGANRGAAVIDAVTVDCGAVACDDASLEVALAIGPSATITAGNPTDPPPGDLARAFFFTHAGATARVDVTVEEQPVAVLQIAEVDGRTSARIDETATFRVVSATNAQDGNEPLSAVWSASEVGWIDAVTGVVTPPQGATSVELTVRGTNASGAFDEEVIRFERPSSSVCVIEAADGSPLPSELRPGQVLELVLAHTLDGEPVGRVEASWDSGSGPAVITSVFSYTAPRAPTEVTITATSAACPAPVSLQLRVDTGVHVSLSADRQNVRPGDLVLLSSEASVDPSTAITRLRVRLVPGSGVAALAAEDRVLDLSAGAQQLRLPVTARAAFAGGRTLVRIEAFDADDPEGAALAAASVTLHIAEDPEQNEATLIGDVFHDVDGDGLRGEGEPGFANVMVALAASVYALTDARGAYHIARLTPGRHVAKIDPSTLPEGAAPTTAWRRELTLTPGMFTKVGFGVRLPDLSAPSSLSLVASESGLLVDGDAITYRAAFRSAAAQLSAHRGEVTVSGQRGDGGVWGLDLPAPADEPQHWLIVERGEDGRVWLSSFALHALAQEGGSVLVHPRGPRPTGRVLLPAPGVASHRTSLKVASDAPVPITVRLDDGCAAPCELPVRATYDALELAVDPPPDELGDDPPAARASLPVQLDPHVHFLVARAGAELSFVGDREPADDGWHLGGAFFYRGQLSHDVFLTAGADVSAQELRLRSDGSVRDVAGIATQLFRHDPTRVFRDLDPEAYFPTYGDGSLTVDERESGGRLFFRAQKGQSYARWGGVNTALDDGELARYVRSLYGFAGRLHWDSDDGEVGLRATLFAAKPDTVAARDELVVTGSSLYHLHRREVVEGSLRVTLETLDEISGLPVRATPLTEGVDYEADYASGTLSLDQALAYRMFAGSITSREGGGHRHRLIVEYEHFAGASLGDGLSAGGRLAGRWGAVTLSVAGVTELTTLDDPRQQYGLAGAALRVDLGDLFRARLELAHSDGVGHEQRRSADGGLRFAEALTLERDGGNAAALELAHAQGILTSSLYGRFVEPGYSDSRMAAGERLLQAGARLGLEPLRATELWAQLDYRMLDRSAAPLDVRTLALAGAAHDFGRFDLRLEGRYQGAPRSDSEAVSAGAELGAQLLPLVRVHGRRLQRFSDPQQSESAVGALFEEGGYSMGLEVGATDELRAFGRLQGGFPLDEETELYLSYMRRSQLAAVEQDTAAGDAVVVGGRRSVSDGTQLYAEQHLQIDGSDRRSTRRVGGEHPLSARTRLLLSYERAALDPDDARVGPSARDAGAIGASYVSEVVQARLTLDARSDRASGPDALQVGASGRVDWRVTGPLTLAASLRGGTAYVVEGSGDPRPSRGLWEGTTGFALRLGVDLFGRYALLHERAGEVVDGEAVKRLSHIGALAAVFEPTRLLALAPKVAYRHTNLELGAGRATDRALLGALRADLHVAEIWDASLEGRVCAAPGSGAEATQGALAEASVLVLQWLRLGAGYNFSSIAAGGVQCREPGARGVFVRAEALY